MSEIKRKWDLISDDRKKICLDEIIRFFEVERGERIGVIAAQDLLDSVLQTAGKELYNIGVQDAKITLEKRVEDLQLDLDMLLD